MKEQTKTIRVRVLRPFFLSRETVATVGDEHELPTDLGMAAVHGGKAERITAAHVVEPTPPPPEVDPFRAPDAEKRVAPKPKGKKHAQ